MRGDIFKAHSKQNGSKNGGECVTKWHWVKQHFRIFYAHHLGAMEEVRVVLLLSLCEGPLVP